MKKILLCSIVLIAIYNSVFSQINLEPTSTTNNVIKYTNYSISYSEKHKQAEWVFYELTHNDYGSTKRTDDFRPDPTLEVQANLSDYKSSGYDRGHLNPAADNTLSRKEMSECFYLTNISPQNPSFNRGKWKKLENQFRKWSKEYNSIFVVTGGILREKLNTIGDGVSIPKFFYKIGYAPSHKKMIAFLMPNEKINDDLSNYTCSVDAIEYLTKIDFFHELVDSLENKLESNDNFDNWHIPTSQTQTSKITATQCLGTTKKGLRCKNKTKNSCGYCYIHKDKPKPKVKKSYNYSGQCCATTKKGRRCKRRASNGSRYCWQHK